MRRRISLLLVIGVLLGAVALCTVEANRALAKRSARTAQVPNERVMISMRSLVPGATGTLLLRARGRLARLSTHGLPRPEALDPRARLFLVWAVGSDGRIVKLGQLRTDAQGGALTFPSQTGLEPYSVIVTAEQNSLAARPTGVPVLTTRAREVVTPQPAVVDGEARQGHQRARVDERVGPARGGRSIGATDFYSVVDAALGAGSGRTIFLTGRPRLPRARGVARVAVVGGTAFVRARLVNLPTPARLGASEYVMWARLSEGRSVYMGSLPARGLNGNDIYVRLNNAGFDNFTLFVTAERMRPAIFPSNRRVLVTRPRARRTRRWPFRRRRPAAGVS